MAVAQNVSGQANMSLNFQQAETTGLVVSQSLQALISQALQYVNATGQSLGVDQLYAVQLTLAAAPMTLHFQTSTLKDMFGNTISMLRIRELLVQNLNTTLGQDLKVESAASNGITWLPPTANPLYARSGTTTASNGYGIIRISDPASFGAGVGNVVSATTDGVTLDPGTNTISVNVVALGCSVA